MKNKGFTLIELLAVIVILAIIALIATPIILGIINDARKESNQRSVELYAAAVKNGIAAHQLTEGKEVKAGTYTKETLPFDVDVDGKVECDTIKIYKDGSIYVADCSVNDKQIDYTYGIQKYEPQYYGLFNGAINSTIDPTNLSTAPLKDKYFYIGYDVNSSNVVSAAYGCFKTNGIEYCLKPGDTQEVYEKNVNIVKEAYKNEGEGSCYYTEEFFECCSNDYNYMCTTINMDGRIDLYDVDEACYVYNDGSFECQSQ